MIGYKIYKYEKDVLEKMKMTEATRYMPVQDINGDWFIFEEEHQRSGLGTPAEYVPPQIQNPL